MFSKILVANRGEIAVRVMRSAKALGVGTVAVHSNADAGSLHVREADEAVDLGPGAAGENYLNITKIVEAAIRTGAQAVHPGYGFLAENADFAQAVIDAGLVFIGPSPAAIATMGEKVAARAVAVSSDVPLAPGSDGAVADADAVTAFGAEHGYPILIKAAYGGGGRGMRQVYSADQVSASFDGAVREATAAFGNGSVYVERYLVNARHVEIQILADTHGNVVAVGDRDCSVQRRHQKLVEEAPAPGLSPETRAAMGDAAVRLARSVDYVGAGTVEFLLDGDKFYFLEMNTRIQVEHPVTELACGIDIVAEQLQIAAGQPMSLKATPTPVAAAIEARINAESVEGGVFRPAPGAITALRVPNHEGIRWDGGYEAGDTVLPNYDSLVGKLIAVGPDRETAIARLVGALRELAVEGISTTAHAIGYIISTDDFQQLRMHTNWLETAVTIPDPDLALDRSEVEVAGRYYRIPYFSDSTVHSGRPPVAASAAPVTGGGGEANSGRAQNSGAVRRRPKSAPFDGTVKAPMQGTIVNLSVSTGDQVDTGQTLFVLEAMKMENPIVAPQAGRLDSISVALGEAVPAGTVLATYAKQA